MLSWSCERAWLTLSGSCSREGAGEGSLEAEAAGPLAFLEGRGSGAGLSLRDLNISQRLRQLRLLCGVLCRNWKFFLEQAKHNCQVADVPSTQLVLVHLAVSMWIYLPTGHGSR